MKSYLYFLLLCSIPLSAENYDQLIHRYEQQINAQEKQLSIVRSQLDNKLREADQLKKKAEESKTQWTLAKETLNQAKQNAIKFRALWKQSHFFAEAAQQDALTQFEMVQAATGELPYWLINSYKQKVEKTDFSTHSIEMVHNRLIVSELVQVAQSANTLREKARMESEKLRAEELAWLTQEQKQQEKAEFYRQAEERGHLEWMQTVQRREALLDERGQMELSEKALQVMLTELREHRSETVEAKRRASELVSSATTAKLTIPKASLPWPVRGEVLQTFGRQYQGRQLFISNGIKIATKPGQIVRSIQEGKVLFADRFQTYGQLIIIQHAHGLHSVYASMGSTQVKVGQVLRALDPVGTTGESGDFYFELRHHEQPINPLVWLTPQRSEQISLRRTFQ